MQAALAPRGDARTFLTHFVGNGLEDDRYVIQRYLSQADGDIVPVETDGARPKGRRLATPVLEPQSMHALRRSFPRGSSRPRHYRFDDYLRKDAVFLFERLFYFLDAKREHGVLVMDETDKREDRRFVARMERYFTRTTRGRARTTWIVPTPFFVSSDMTYAVQAADLCIYAINWGFRLPSRGMDAPRRNEISNMFGADLANLQYRGQGYRNGLEFRTYGIVHVPDPYEPRPKA